MDETAVLTQDLRRIALEGGADLFGVADLLPGRELIREQGGEFVSSFPRAVSIAAHLSPAMVEQVAERNSASAAWTYHFYVYQVVNPELNSISNLLVRRLVQSGYRAYLVPASGVVDRERHYGVFSHKLAAHLAGLGFIGRSCLLVTPKYGGRVRLATVLTDAPLETGIPLDRACGECRRCVEICPPRAFSGVEFRAEDPREVRFKADLCYRFLSHREKTMGTRACGLCVLVCDGSLFPAR